VYKKLFTVVQSDRKSLIFDSADELFIKIHTSSEDRTTKKGLAPGNGVVNTNDAMTIIPYIFQFFIV
jgi:hypothetical protein